MFTLGLSQRSSFSPASCGFSFFWSSSSSISSSGFQLSVSRAGYPQQVLLLPLACRDWGASLHLGSVKISMPEENLSHFWCFPFLISFSLDCGGRSQGRRKGFTASSGRRPALQTSQPLPWKTVFFCKWGYVYAGFLWLQGLCKHSLCVRCLHALGGSEAWFQVDRTEVEGISQPVPPAFVSIGVPVSRGNSNVCSSSKIIIVPLRTAQDTKNNGIREGSRVREKLLWSPSCVTFVRVPVEILPLNFVW